MRWAHVVAGLIIASAPAGAQLVSGNFCGYGAANRPGETFCAAMQMEYVRAIDTGPDHVSATFSVTRGQISQIYLQVPYTDPVTLGVGSSPRLTPTGATILGGTGLQRDGTATGEQVEFYASEGLWPLIGACGSADTSDPEGTGAFAYLTCDPNGGAPGSVRFDFDVWGVADPAAFTFAVNGFACAWTGGQLDASQSRDCAESATVSPEPATLALVAPALLALGVRKRRRRGTHPVT